MENHREEPGPSAAEPPEDADHAREPGAAINPLVVSPLLPEDPTRVGDFWPDARITASPAGVAFVCHDDAGESAMLLLLSEGAAADPVARARFAGEIDAMHIDTVIARGGQGQDHGRTGVKYRSSAEDPVAPDDAPLVPWAALAYSGTHAALAEAERVLAEVDLSRTPPLGASAGPDFALPWIDKTRPGGWRPWPLPWPGRRDRAGWISLAASWALLMVLASLAVLLALIVFQNRPPTQSPSVVGGQGGQASPQPASPSPTQGSTTSPSPGETQTSSGEPSLSSPTMTPSMEHPSPGGTATLPGAPSPNRRL